MLRGHRILIVEDEALIALDLEAALREAGADVVGIGRSPAQALALAETADPTGAIVDLRLNNHSARDVVRRLSERGIPFIFYSGLEDAPTATSWPRVPLLTKPTSPETIIAVLARVLGTRSSSNRAPPGPACAKRADAMAGRRTSGAAFAV